MNVFSSLFFCAAWLAYSMQQHLRYFWKKAPMLRFAIPFISGIVLQQYFSFELFILLICICTCLLLIGLQLILKLSFRYRFSFLPGLFIQCAIISAGSIILYLSEPLNDPHHFHHLYQEGDVIELKITEQPIEKNASWKSVAQIISLNRNGRSVQCNGKLLVYFQKNIASIPALNTQLLIKTTARVIRNAGNPGEFDMHAFYSRQNITHQLFVTEDDFILLPTTRSNSLKMLIERVRSNILSIIRKNIGPQEVGLAEALLIGYRNDLDKTLVQSYADTGIVHIIAVSGMHVGMIYTLILFITLSLNNKRYNLLRFALVITSLWCFGLIAGAEPSVLRSCFMFSVMMTGKLWNRKTSVYNTLAFAAVALLIDDPNVLWNLGFQLSFLAVLSIIIFYKPIYQAINFNNRIIDFAWQVIALTTAAQILTTPVSIYYFHQFPLLFILSNLFAVPLSGLIIYGIIIMIFVSALPPLGSFFGFINSQLIGLLNKMVNALASVDFAVIDGLHISPIQTILFYLIIILTSAFVFTRRRKFIKPILVTILFFISSRSFADYRSYDQKAIAVYNFPKQSCIDLFSGKVVHSISSAPLNEFAASAIKNAREKFRVNTVRSCSYKDLLLAGKRIVIARDLPVRLSGKKTIDLLIISGDRINGTEQLLKYYTIREIVTDSSVPRRMVTRLKAACNKASVPFYDVSEKGAFLMKL